MKYRIEQDTDAQSPSDLGDKDLFIVAKHRDFYVPAPGEKRVPEYANEVVEQFKKTHHVFPIEAYIHSGVVLAFSQEGNFPDRRWDVSQVGFAFASKKEWRVKAKAREAAASLIEQWNQYSSGDVWGYIIEDDEGNHVDSCWGFYGRAYCEQEAKSAMESALSIG